MATVIKPPRKTWWEYLLGLVPAVSAAFYFGASAICAALAISPRFRLVTTSLRESLELWTIPLTPNLAYAVFLALLAGALHLRKKVAFWLAVVLFAGPQLLLVLFDGSSSALTWLAFVWSLGVLALLVAARDEFYARTPRLCVLRGAAVTVIGFAISTVIGFVLALIFPRSLDNPGEAFAWVLSKVTGGVIAGSDLGILGRGPHLLAFMCGFMGALSILAGVVELLRSQRARSVLSSDAERQVRALLARYGDADSLGYFATRRDKTAVFAPDGDAVVSYRVVAGVGLASGDPVGAPQSWNHAIAEWLRVCRTYAWVPAVIGASERGAKAYARAGLGVLELGDEAIVQVSDFTLKGRAMRMVRQAVARVQRLGYTVRVRRHADVPLEEMREVIAFADAWRDTETERGFSMALGRLGDPDDANCVLVEAMDAQGNVRGLLSLAPWGANGLSLDLMRRDRAADNGLMEFMVTKLVEVCPQLRVRRISLNFAMFRSTFSAGARIGAGPILRAWRGLLLFGSRFWQLESLYRANAKFLPDWVPRYFCFGDARYLPRMGIATAIAEGFLEPPTLWSLLGKRGERDADELVPQPRFTHVPSPGAITTIVRSPEQVRVRKAKVDALRANGREPYPVNFSRSHSIGEVVKAFGFLPTGGSAGRRVSIAGRVLRVRDHGGLVFATIQDFTGSIQVMLDATRCVTQREWRRFVDIGDWVGAEGEVIRSDAGELSVLVNEWTLTAKCLRPLPSKHEGLHDPEARVRQRYLDLAVNASTKDVLVKRSDAIASLRSSLRSRGFLEVETPMLQTVHGGANARPFGTHINAYDLDLYLRIAPELFLKRLCVGGVEKVFELGRNFRNEGADATHNPEFTSLEAYQAYADYRDMAELSRSLIQDAARSTLGSTVLAHGRDEIDLGGTWRFLTVHEAVSMALGEPVTADTPVELLRAHAQRAKVPFVPTWTAGHIVLRLYEHLVEGKTIEPTFYLDFPAEVSPLAREHRQDPRLAERWDLVIAGMEVGTAYSELIDPAQQRRRLEAQSLAAAGGDVEAMEVDEDFLLALEYAMPPTGGLGLGVDRLVMLFVDRNIRDVISFPLVKPGGR